MTYQFYYSTECKEPVFEVSKVKDREEAWNKAYEYVGSQIESMFCKIKKHDTKGQ